MKSLALATLFTLILSTSYGCTRKVPQSSLYVQRSAQEQADAQLESQVSPLPMNQTTRSDLRLDSPNYQEDLLKRHDYESYPEWKKRIKELFEQNHDLFLCFNEEYQRLEKARLDRQAELEEIKAINQLLETKIHSFHEDPQAAQNDPVFANLSQKLPFTIHLVRENETLYSIAQLYYSSGDKVPDITSWNQGWILNPEKLMAGLCLVLFFDDYQAERGQTTVNKYIKEVQKQLNETLLNQN